MQYVNFRNDTLLRWSVGVLAKIFDFCKGADYAADWVSVYIHFATVYMKTVRITDRRSFRRKVKSEPGFLELQRLVEAGRFPIKVRFKWMDFTDLVDGEQ